MLFQCGLANVDIDAVADGGGVVSHYSFGVQLDGMDKTDVLDRYRSYAKQNVCKTPMLWTEEEDALALPSSAPEATYSTCLSSDTITFLGRNETP